MKKKINDIEMLKCMRYVLICFKLIYSLSFNLNFCFLSNFYICLILTMLLSNSLYYINWLLEILRVM